VGAFIGHKLGEVEGGSIATGAVLAQFFLG